MKLTLCIKCKAAPKAGPTTSYCVACNTATRRIARAKARRARSPEYQAAYRRVFNERVVSRPGVFRCRHPADKTPQTLEIGDRKEATKKVEIEFRSGRDEVTYTGVARVEDGKYEYKLFDEEGNLLASVDKGEVKNLITRG
jgi:hypothetical protein